jgi:hypothetical protein
LNGLAEDEKTKNGYYCQDNDSSYINKMKDSGVAK